MKNVIRLFLILGLWGFVAAASAEKAAPFIIIPSKGDGPFPVALWLHGYRGYSPDGYVPGQPRAALQKHADALGAVIIGFPATTDLEDSTQQWTENPVTDQAYIQGRLKEIAKTVKLDLTRVGLFGFSQGAKVAGDLATLYPDQYRGAILMSPGSFEPAKAARQPKPAHAKQVYYCLCGTAEHPDNVALTREYAKRLEKDLGAKVTLKLYPGVSKHSRPADFMEKFPEWMNAILKADSK